MKNITCSVIDSPPKRWGFWRDIRKRETYLNFENPFPDNSYFCSNVLNVKERDKALIHDFGRCFDVDDNIPVTYKSTLLSFCNEFLLCKNRDDLNIPREIVGSIEDLQSFVEKEDININNIENVYTSFIIPTVSGSF